MRHPGWLASLALLASVSVAYAEEMQIEPGKWEFIRTAPATMGGAPTKKTNTECLHDANMTPQKFMAEMKACQLSDVQTSAAAMSWKMSCPSPMGAMTGGGAFQSTGSEISGTLDMTVKMGAQDYPMQNSWTGRRVGDCD